MGTFNPLLNYLTLKIKKKIQLQKILTAYSKSNYKKILTAYSSNFLKLFITTRSEISKSKNYMKFASQKTQ